MESNMFTQYTNLSGDVVAVIRVDPNLTLETAAIFITSSYLTQDTRLGHYVAAIGAMVLEFTETHHEDIILAIALMLKEAAAYEIGKDEQANGFPTVDDDNPLFRILLDKLFSKE